MNSNLVIKNGLHTCTLYDCEEMNNDLYFKLYVYLKKGANNELSI